MSKSTETFAVEGNRPGQARLLGSRRRKGTRGLVVVELEPGDRRKVPRDEAVAAGLLHDDDGASAA